MPQDLSGVLQHGTDSRPRGGSARSRTAGLDSEVPAGRAPRRACGSARADWESRPLRTCAPRPVWRATKQLTAPFTGSSGWPFTGPSGWPNPSLLPGLSRWSVCSQFPSGSLSPRRRFPSFRPRTCQRSGQCAASRSWIEPARFAASELEAGNVQLLDHGSSPLDSLPAKRAM